LRISGYNTTRVKGIIFAHSAFFFTRALGPPLDAIFPLPVCAPCSFNPTSEGFVHTAQPPTQARPPCLQSLFNHPPVERRRRLFLIPIAHRLRYPNWRRLPRCVFLFYVLLSPSLLFHRYPWHQAKSRHLHPPQYWLYFYLVNFSLSDAGDPDQYPRFFTFASTFQSPPSRRQFGGLLALISPSHASPLGFRIRIQDPILLVFGLTRFFSSFAP